MQGFADDLVVLVDSHARHSWIVAALKKRLREEFEKLRVEINEEKSRMVDLRKKKEVSDSWDSSFDVSGVYRDDGDHSTRPS